MTDHKDTFEQVIRDFKLHRWRDNPYERAMELVVSHPEQIESFIRVALTELDESTTFINDALSFIDKSAFSRLTNDALATLEQAPNHRHEIAESVIGSCSFQFPELLHPHLDHIFDLAPNADSYIENYPWRDSGRKHFGYLRAILKDSSQSPEKRDKAWRCLLETRDIESMRWALQQSHNASLCFPPENYLNEVGFHWEKEQILPLAADPSFHLIFESNYPIDRQQWWQKIHPTWKMSSQDQIQAAFGGYSASICSGCGRPLHHFITLQPIPPGIVVTDLDQLELACCLSCLGWEQSPLFYQHDKFGTPESTWYEKTNVTPEFVTTAFQATSIRLTKTPARWRWQDWAYSNSRENLNRLGGHPSWVQSSEYPNCPSCQKLMQFLLQLDSDLPTQDGGTWLWGSGGLGYVFWCGTCRVSGYLWQCT